MYNLDKAYNKKFFARRKSLDWRVPIVLNAIMRSLGPRSIIDFGCARGEYVNGFIKIGIPAIGIEGSSEVLDYIIPDKDKIIISDLRLPIKLDKKYDLCMCFEVLEHIEEKYTDQLMKNFRKVSNRILVSAAPPGQGGNHHVNCKDKSWWENKFFEFDYIRHCVKEEEVKKYFTNIHRKEIKVYYNNLMYFEQYV